MQLQGLGNPDIIRGVNRMNQEECTSISILIKGEKSDSENKQDHNKLGVEPEGTPPNNKSQGQMSRKKMNAIKRRQ